MEDRGNRVTSMEGTLRSQKLVETDDASLGEDASRFTLDAIRLIMTLPWEVRSSLLPWKLQ